MFLCEGAKQVLYYWTQMAKWYFYKFGKTYDTYQLRITIFAAVIISIPMVGGSFTHLSVFLKLLALGALALLFFGGFAVWWVDRYEKKEVKKKIEKGSGKDRDS